MFKLIFIALFSAVLAEDGKGKLYSLHAPHNTPGSLNLTTGELKLFSGHAMNIIRSKCPAVDSDKIFQVTKYIGKLIAKTNPVQGTSKNFKSLLETMTTCAKEGVIPKKPVMEDRSSVFRTLFYPFRHMKTIWFNHAKPNEDDKPISAQGVDFGLTNPESSTEVPETDIKSQSTDAPPTRRIIKTTIFVRPADMQEGIRSSGGFFNWVHNIFSRVGGFFGNFLPFGMMRRKRDVSDSQSMLETTDDQSARIQETASRFQSVYTPAKDESKGKHSFGQLIDEMCRLYCDTCTGQKEIMDFKRAAKELLAFLFNEDSGIELAARKFLGEEFLQSIQSCQ